MIFMTSDTAKAIQCLLSVIICCSEADEINIIMLSNESRVKLASDEWITLALVCWLGEDKWLCMADFRGLCGKCSFCFVIEIPRSFILRSKYIQQLKNGIWRL